MNKLNDIWNLDETDFFWKALSDKSLSRKGERSKGGTKSKQRLTAFIVNAAAEKEEPVIVGKSALPRYFKNLKDKSPLLGPTILTIKKLGWIQS